MTEAPSQRTNGWTARRAAIHEPNLGETDSDSSPSHRIKSCQATPAFANKRLFAGFAAPDLRMKLITTLTRLAGLAFGSRHVGKPSRSQLVGMYLSQANSRDAYSPEFQENRQRRNGRFASTRERA